MKQTSAKVNKRVEAIDVYRGMAVLGFIIWHAFDLFYSGNEYKAPIFRAVILTRISFVMISATVLGLKSWSNYKLRDHLKRSIKIMMYPITIGILKSIVLSTPEPIAQIINYPLYGNGHFTFSILIALGLLYLLLPLILKHRLIHIAAEAIAILLIILEITEFIELPEFWRFMSVSVLFANIGKYIVHFSKSKIYLISSSLLLINLALFSMLVIYEDVYWTIRNYTLFEMLLLVLSTAGLTFNFFLLQGLKWLKQLFLTLGNNSLFIYIGHYVLYVIVSVFIGFHKSTIVGLSFVSMLTILIFIVLNKLFRNQIAIINQTMF